MSQACVDKRVIVIVIVLVIVIVIVVVVVVDKRDAEEARTPERQRLLKILGAHTEDLDLFAPALPLMRLEGYLRCVLPRPP